MTWVPLSDATTIMDHDVEKARQSLERAISKAWLITPAGSPQPAIDPNVPLRIRVTPSPGWRLAGRAWLDQPMVCWDDSEIECLCAPWMPSGQSQPSVPTTQMRAHIEIWREDIVRLWSRDGTSVDGLPPVRQASSERTDSLSPEMEPSPPTGTVSPCLVSGQVPSPAV